MTWPDVIRDLLDAGIPAGRIGAAVMVLENGGTVREAERALHGDRQGAPMPAVFIAELLVAEAARAAVAEKVAVER